MDHPLNKLDECVFDYLVLHADKPVALPKIFNDIRSGSGHRCEQLINSRAHWQHFLATCYKLDKNYKNIKKLYRNNHLYLMFQKDRQDTDFGESFYDDSAYENTNWKDDYDLNNIINYMCDNAMLDDFYFSNLFDNSDTLLHLLVRYNRYNEFENLLKSNSIDLNKKNLQGETPLDLAITLKNKRMIKLLINHLDNNMAPRQQSQIITHPEATYSKYYRYLSTAIYIFGMWYIASNLYAIYN